MLPFLPKKTENFPKFSHILQKILINYMNNTLPQPFYENFDNIAPTVFWTKIFLRSSKSSGYFPSLSEYSTNSEKKISNSFLKFL